MDKKEILHATAEWQEQDKENRAILFLAAEHEKDKENTKSFSLSQGLAGNKLIVKSMIKNAMKEDINIVEEFKNALAELTFEAFANAIQKEMKKNSVNSNETAQEEQQ